MKRTGRRISRARSIVILAFVLGPAAFGQDRRPPAIPFEISNNLVLVQTSVNGSKPLAFILDTGAGGSVINETRAKDLGLKLERGSDATTGDGDVEASSVKNAEIKISSARLRDLTLTAIDLSGLEAGIGRRIDGILGHDVFARYVVEIDYVARSVKLHEPKAYRYPGRSQPIPITIDDNRPFIRGIVTRPGAKPAEGRFEFDTGQVSAVILGETFTTKNQLLPEKTVHLMTGAILAGRSSAQTGRIQGLRIGGFSIDHPVTNFVQGNRGEADTSDYAGQIGGEILRRFRVVIDYSRKHVILEPNRSFSEPYEFDMSGVSLISSGADFDSFRVRALVDGSPATEAGLRVGDVLTSIDAKPTSRMTLDQIRRAFRRTRQRFTLGIKRDEKPLTVVLKTRRLV